MKGMQLGLSRFRLLSPMSSSIMIFVLGIPNQGLQWWKSREIGKGSLSTILEFIGIVPQSLDVGSNKNPSIPSQGSHTSH
jgi:hypothetical protein